MICMNSNGRGASTRSSPLRDSAGYLRSAAIVLGPRNGAEYRRDSAILFVRQPHKARNSCSRRK